LIETDAPDLAPSVPAGVEPPEWARTGINEPAALPRVAAKVAELLGRPVEDVAGMTAENALRLFLGCG
jgi:Tat protein secretion system quality control protein TatD with DNase activity